MANLLSTNHSGRTLLCTQVASTSARARSPCPAASRCASGPPGARPRTARYPPAGAGCCRCRDAGCVQRRAVDGRQLKCLLWVDSPQVELNAHLLVLRLHLRTAESYAGTAAGHSDSGLYVAQLFPTTLPAVVGEGRVHLRHRALVQLARDGVGQLAHQLGEACAIVAVPGLIGHERSCHPTSPPRRPWGPAAPP